MDKPASPPFRAHIRVLTERSRPDPITVVAWTGVDFWLRVEVPPNVLVRSPGQRQREVGRIIREHYAVWGKRRDVDRLLGRAWARVLAHELYHVLANTSSHGGGGIAQPRFSSRELLDDNMEFNIEDVEKMRPPAGDHNLPSTASADAAGAS